MVNDVLETQPDAFVTDTLYVPGARLFTVAGPFKLVNVWMVVPVLLVKT